MSTPQTQAHTPIPISASATKTPHFANSPAYISTPSAQAASSTPNQTQSKELSPQTFDIIAPLHELLSRVLATSASPFQNTATSLGGGGGGGLTAPGGLHAFPGSQPLEAKDVATEAASIRARIRRAREICAEIEWGDRTLGSLEEEERELKTRIERMRRVGGGGSP